MSNFLKINVFDFGQNWIRYSEFALNRNKVEQAKNDFITLVEGIKLNKSFFLDVGFGQGLTLAIAKELGCRVLGCEVNPKSIIALHKTLLYFPKIKKKEIPVILGSILDKQTLTQLRNNNKDGYEIVYSWGVLHHTGNLKLAITNAASLVKKNGYLILAIYNKHWSSPFWKVIKKFYCASPAFVQKVIIIILFPVIFFAKFIILKGKNPFLKNRGMDFYYDVVDWVGGYPYEYASVEEISNYMIKLGYRKIKVILAEVPTGCNQFVFQRLKNI